MKLTISRGEWVEMGERGINLKRRIEIRKRCEEYAKEKFREIMKPYKKWVMEI